MRLHFRTRGGPTQGWGNVYRLAAFAALCRSRLDAEILFIAEGPPAAAALLRDRGFAVEPLPDDVDLDAEATVLDRHPCADTTIVEMLEATWERQGLLKDRCGRLVVLDDLLDQRYCADVVVCGQPLPSYANRDIADPGTEFHCGLAFFPLSPGFAAAAAVPRRLAETPERLLVALGGGRYDVACIKVAAAVAVLGSEAPRSVRFVLGPAGTPNLVSAIRDRLPTAEVVLAVDDMPAEYLRADIAVVGAGYAKIEAAAAGTPAVMIATQWHQIPLAETAAPLLGMPYLGYMGFVHVAEIAEAIRALTPVAVRERQIGRARAAVPSDGAERLFHLLFGDRR